MRQTNLDSCEFPLSIRVFSDAVERRRHDSDEQVDEYHRTTEEIDAIDERSSDLGDVVTIRVNANRLVSAMFKNGVWKDNISVRLRLEAVERPV